MSDHVKAWGTGVKAHAISRGEQGNYAIALCGEPVRVYRGTDDWTKHPGFVDRCKKCDRSFERKA